MNKEPQQPLMAFSAVAAIAFAVGFFISDDSAIVAKLQAELAQRPPPKHAAQTSAAGIWKGTASIRRSGSAGPAGASDSAQEWPPNELFAKLKITKEDWDKTWEMNKRKDQGEYLLNNERPTTRKFLDWDFSEIVARKAEQRAAEYDRLFAELGVKPETAEQLKTHVAKIQRAALEAEVAIDQLLTARRDYDQRVRSTMGEESYQRYRQVEDAKPAVREYQRLQEFAGTKNMPIDPQHEQALVGLIQQNQAYTARSWRGPFEGLRQPIVGAENLIPATEQQIAQITERANQVVSRAAEAGLPENYKNLLASYYTEKVQEKKREIEALKNCCGSNMGNQSPAPANGPAH